MIKADRVSCLSLDPAVPEPADQGEAAVAVPPATKMKKSFASFFKHDTVTSTIHTKRERIENELTSYLQSVVRRVMLTHLNGGRKLPFHH